MSKKMSNHYPEQFAKVAYRTLEEGCWEVEMDTPAQANSFKTMWYNYVAALLREGDNEKWGDAIRVLVTTVGKHITFEDRNKSKLALKMDSWFVGKERPKDQAQIDFEEMMKARNKE